MSPVEERQTSMHRVAPGTLLTLQRARQKRSRPTTESPLIVSVSELADFMDCRVKWWARHQARLEPKEASVNLGIGSLTHNILDAWYQLPRTKRTPKRMEKIARGHVNTTTLKQLKTEDKDLVEAMTIGYAHWALDPEEENSDVEVGYDKGFPEEWFTTPLNKEQTVFLRGRYDNRFIPTNRRKFMALLEVKTAAQIKMSKFEHSIQVGGYFVSMTHDFPGYKFVVYPTVMRKQMPTERVRAPLFAREAVEFTPEEVEMIRKDLLRAALDMTDAAVYASPAERCEWRCDYKGPCQLRHDPEDLKHVLSTEYQPKEYR
jgi:hypothetical protein